VEAGKVAKKKKLPLEQFQPYHISVYFCRHLWVRPHPSSFLHAECPLPQIKNLTAPSRQTMRAGGGEELNRCCGHELWLDCGVRNCYWIP